MNKAKIIEQIVAQTKIYKPAVTVIVEGIMATIKQTMVRGENIYLRGFGTFLLKKRAAKTGRNISKGTSVKIPAQYIPKFKPAKGFAEKVAAMVKVK